MFGIKRLPQSVITLSVLLVVIISAAIEIDIFVPSFPAIQAFFDTTEAKVKMILSVNFLGLCISSLLVGPLTDSFGRRNTLLAGLAIFSVASIASVFSPNMETLLLCRFFQGVGCSAAFVIPGAILFDLHSKEEAAKILGWYNSIITLSISAAPLIGTYLHITHGWRANFIFITVLSALAFILVLAFAKESLTKEHRTPWNVPGILRGYGRLLSSFPAITSLAIMNLMVAGYIAYIGNLSILFINYFGMEEKIYAYYQGVVLFVFAAVSISCGKIMQALGMEKTRLWGKVFSFFGATSLLITAIFFPKNPVLITVAMCCFSAGFAAMVGIVFADYMNIYPEIKGIASALCQSTRLLFMAIAIAISNIMFNGTILSIALIIFTFSALAMILLLLLQRQQKA